MVNKTNRAKSLLEQSLSAMPQDWALRDARLLIAKALQEIKTVEHKRDRRSKGGSITPEQKYKLDMETGSIMAPPLTNQQQQNVLANIEQMIQSEQEKIKQPESTTDQTLFD